MFRRLLRPLRRLASEFFYNFGLHCAKYQIRVILISDLVITSLFYPALAIYFSSQPLSHFSSRLTDSLLAFNPNAAIFRSDLSELWDGLPEVRLREDSAAQARCGSERTIRLERFLVRSIEEDHPFGVLNQVTFDAASDLQHRIRSALADHSNDAIGLVLEDKAAHGIFALEPSLFRPKDSSQSLGDYEIVTTVNSGMNVTLAGIPLSRDIFLAGRGAVDDRDWIYEAEYLAVTYFFIESDCNSRVKHVAWTQLLQEAIIGHGVVAHTLRQPNLIALEFDKGHRPYPAGILSKALYGSYIIIFVYFSGALRRIDTVHSRFGLAFTGIVEIVASTVTSVSVCALWGFRITMVPWAILPVMIVFIGAEDMFILIQEVVSTPISLPVKERIARGLSRAGTSNTFKVVTYNAIFGSMAYFATGAIKQFCIFTVVVLVAHWFLIHTFFVAVLAIDIQRLELADLLHQDSRNDKKVTSSLNSKASERSDQVVAPKSRWRWLRKDRAAKNGSLVVILAITILLYYASLPNPIDKAARLSRKSHAAAARESFIQSVTMAQPTMDVFSDESLLEHQHQAKGDSVIESPSSRFWHLFNPQNDALLHLRIEPPSLVTFISPDSRRTSDEQPLHHAKRRALLRNLQPLIWAVKIVILPMSATAFALWCLLLWLLKDAELLEAQRDRAEPGAALGGNRSATRPQIKTSPIEGHAIFRTGIPVFVADVERLAISGNGVVVAAASAQNEIAIWEGSNLRPTIVIKQENLLSGLNNARARFSAIALNHNGSRCTIGTSDGLVVQWDIYAGMMSRYSSRAANAVAVVSIHPLCSGAEHNHTPHGAVLPVPPPLWPVLILYDDGTATLWRASGAVHVPSLDRNVHAPAVWCEDDDNRLTLTRPRAGCLEIFSIEASSSSSEWTSTIIPDVNDSSETITCMTIETILMDRERHMLVASVTASGRITIYDVVRKHLLCSIEVDREDITKLALASVPLVNCKQCGHLEPDSFLLVCSAGTNVDIYRAIAMLVPNRCSCSTSQLHRSGGSKSTLRDKSQHQRSRTSSLTTATLSPTMRASLSAAPSLSQNLHSRRASEQDVKSRQSLETVFSDTTDAASDTPGIDTLLTNLIPQPDLASRSPLDITGSIKLVKVDGIPNERGVWELSETTLLGVRRKPRSPFNSDQRNNRKVDPAAQVRDSLLSRWEVWSFNLLDRRMLASPVLQLEDASMTPSVTEIQDRLNDDGSLFRRSAGMRRLVELSNGTAATAIAQAVAGRPSDLTDPYGAALLPFTRLSIACLSGRSLAVGFGNMPGLLSLSDPPRATGDDPAPNTTQKKNL